MSSIKTSRFLFYLTPEFTMLAFTSALEVLRLTNQVLGQDAYEWKFVSADGDPVSASCGISIKTDFSLVEARTVVSAVDRPRMILICGGRNVQRYENRLLSSWLREGRMRGVNLGAICTGAYLLARTGLLHERRCTIHWENLPAFAEQFPEARSTSQIYEVDDGLYTCAGGTASIEMMLHIVGQDFGFEVASTVCQKAIVAFVRDQSERQRLPFTLQQVVTNPAIRSLVSTMQENLSETLDMNFLSRKIGLSRRQIERLFRNELNCSPARYYVKLRLERARSLLEQTAMPIVDIAIACGFVSASHFSKLYRSVLGVAPTSVRKANIPEWAE